MSFKWLALVIMSSCLSSLWTYHSTSARGGFQQQQATPATGTLPISVRLLNMYLTYQPQMPIEKIKLALMMAKERKEEEQLLEELVKHFRSSGYINFLSVDMLISSII